MNEKPAKSTFEQVVEITIRLGFLLFLLAWCFQILYPFLAILIWGVILAIALHPLADTIANLLGKSPKWAATVITALALAIILVPSYFLVGSLVTGLKDLGQDLATQTLEIPAPNAEVANWPLIGNWLYDTWLLASENLGDAVVKYDTQLSAIGSALLDSAIGTGVGILQFVLSLVIAGIILGNYPNASKAGKLFFRKVIGQRGDEFARIADLTVLNVAKGILGVALIQSLLAGFGFFFAGVPYAGLWALLILILGIIQIGPTLVMIPIIIYLYSTSSALPATLWSIYFILVGLSDNALKPWLMGKGAPVPTLIIFFGAIGGFILSGFIGLFTGAIVLSLGYKLFQTWLDEEPAPIKTEKT